jgi:serine protease Do
MIRTRYFLTGLLLAGMTLSAYAIDPLLKQFEDAFVRLGDEVRPSVVNIDTKVVLEEAEMPDAMGQLEDLFKYFGMPSPDQRQMRPQAATGSGFVLDKEGHILTNNHVVEGAQEITVRLWNGSEHKGEVIGSDPDTDLAVIQIKAPADDLRPVTLGDSDTLKVGQFAIAMGSPRGFEGSLSFGHISALGRENLNLPGMRFQNFIQTDAAINLGNSGGPLTNIDGDVVGINVAIVWGAESLGFAIPINTAKQIVPELIEKGKVVRGYLGVVLGNAEPYAAAIGLPDGEGAFVTRVEPGTPAADAGLKRYDVIRQIDGVKVKGAGDVVGQVSKLSPGTTVTVEVWRDGSTQNIEVKLGEFPGAEKPGVKEDSQLLGMSIQPLTPEIAERLGVPATTAGVVLTNVQPGSAADDAGLRRGDIVIEIAQQQIASIQQFRKLIEDAAPGADLLVAFIRGGAEPQITVLEVPEVEAPEVPEVLEVPETPEAPVIP